MPNNVISEFLISIGFSADDAKASQAAALAAKTEARITASTKQGSADRVKTAQGESKERWTAAQYQAYMAEEAEKAQTAALAKEAAKRTKLAQTEGQASIGTAVAAQKNAEKLSAKRKLDADVEANRNRDRRKVEFRDIETRLLQVNGILSAVSRVAGGLFGSVSLAGLASNIAQTAQGYSSLKVQSELTGASPRNITVLAQAARAMGVPEGEVQSSFAAFAERMKNNPVGMLDVLRGIGVQTTDAQGKTLDNAQLFQGAGTAVGGMDPVIARQRGAFLGMGQNYINVLRRQKEFEAERQKADRTLGNFGLDPNKAADDAREFEKHYSELAFTLGTIKDKIEAEFFVPINDGMVKLDRWINEHPDEAKKFGEGLVAFAALMTLQVIPVLTRLTGLTKLLAAFAPPAWLLRFLGPVGAAAAVMNPVPLNQGEGEHIGGGDWRMPDGTIQHRGMGGGGSTPPPPEAHNTAFRNHIRHAVKSSVDAVKRKLGIGVNTGSNAGSLTKLINEESALAGIDPRIMQGIRAGESGHGSNYDKKDDAIESSWGPFQLNRRRGLGVQFEKETGLDLRDPRTIAAQARWVANYIKKGGSLGAWMGYHGPRDADARWGNSGYVPTPATMQAKIPSIIGPAEAKEAERPTVTPPAGPPSSKFFPVMPGEGPLGDGTIKSDAYAQHSPMFDKPKIRGTALTGDTTTPADKDVDIRIEKSVLLHPALTGKNPPPRPILQRLIPVHVPSDYVPHDDGARRDAHRPEMPAILGGSRMLPAGRLLNLDDFRVRPLGGTSLIRGDTNFTQNVTVQGVQNPREVADHVKATARRGGQDYIRFVEGSSQ